MRRMAAWQRIAVCICGGLLSIARTAASTVPAPDFRHVDLPNRLISPRLGAIADVTGDGHLDLVVGSTTGLYILPGNGIGEFPNWYRATDDVPSAADLAAADFNGDGRLDLVVRTATDGIDAQMTQVLLAQPDGRFHSVADLTTHLAESGGQPHVGDFNGDGVADVLIGHLIFGGNSLHSLLDTYLGHGDGSFADPVHTEFLSNTYFFGVLYVGDLTGDGRTDVVTLAQSSWTVQIWIADGSGGFRPPVALAIPAIRDILVGNGPPRARDVVAADLNGDGTPDLLVRFYYRGKSSDFRSGVPREASYFYFGDGSGQFGTPTRLLEPDEHRRYNVTQLLADVNRDGRADILLTGQIQFSDYNSPIANTPAPTDTYLAVGGATFGDPLLSPATGGDFGEQLEIKARLSDVDGDGLVDLVTDGPNVLSVARGDGVGHFAPGRYEGMADNFWSAGAAVADFNGDGHPDIAVAHSATSNVSIWLGDGQGGWSGPTNYRLSDHDSPIAIAAADVNADGAVDLITANTSDGGGAVGVSILYGDGAAHFDLGRQLPARAPVALAVADFDGDGSVDLAVCDNQTRRVDIFFDMPGTTRQVTLEDSSDFDGGNGLSGIAVADFDGNGFPDIVRSSPSGTASVFFNVGHPELYHIARVPMGVPTFNIAAGDLDGDGIPDLAAPYFNWSLLLGGIVVARGDGAGGFGTPMQYVVGRYFFAHNVSIADLNGAGKRAVVVDGGGLRVLVADASGHLSAPTTVDTSFATLRAVALVDVNHDGLIDAIRPDAVFLNLGACGDGRLDPQEECDDGNTMSCDGCSSDCHREPAVCGNGVIDSDCEQCDDGAANSNTQPGACRTNCRFAHCGDGVLDPGEACDDGNGQSCDGCSAGCKIDTPAVCGDGIVRPDCGEQCDDGNQIAGDGCTPTCEAEMIPGGGPKSTDCTIEWQVVNPNNRPLLDATGRLRSKQKCHDNDPTCDFDGGVIGTCSFRVTLCAGLADPALPNCTPSGLTGWTVVRPSEADARRSATAAVTRQTLTAAGESLLTQALGSCAPPLTVNVPLQRSATGLRAASQVLKTRASTLSGKFETDTLKFTCLP